MAFTRREFGKLALAGLPAATFLDNPLLGTVFALIRTALFVGLFAVVAWVVLVGPPDMGRKR